MNGIFISSSNEMGDVRAGSVAALFGPVMAVVMGGVDGDWQRTWRTLIFSKLRGLDKVINARPTTKTGDGN